MTLLLLILCKQLVLEGLRVLEAAAAGPENFPICPGPQRQFEASPVSDAVKINSH